MNKKKLLRNFTRYTMSEKDSGTIKGGRRYVPTNTGSYGYVNWDEVVIRKPDTAAMTSFLQTG